MLRIVIDKAFSDWYVANTDMNKEVFSDFLEFVKYLDNKLEVFTDLSIKDKNNIHPLLLYLINTNNPGTSFFKSIEEISSEEFFNDCPYYTMFFIDVDQVKADKFTTNYGVEVFTPSSFSQKWKYYLTGRMRELVQAVGPKGFDSWDKLKSFNHPVRSLIICDPYILSDEKKIRTNVISLIEALLSLRHFEGVRQINIVTTDHGNEKSNNYWNKIYEVLLEIRSKYNNLDIYLFRYPKKTQDHFRAIFTPYWMIYSGNSFNYFDERNNVLGNIKDNIVFHSPFMKNDANMIRTRLSDVKDYILKSVDGDQSYEFPELYKRRFYNTAIDNNFVPKLIDDYLD